MPLNLDVPIVDAALLWSGWITVAAQTKLTIAYFFSLKGSSILSLADSNHIDPQYKHIHEVVGDIEVWFLGMECDGGTGNLPIWSIINQIIT